LNKGPSSKNISTLFDSPNNMSDSPSLHSAAPRLRCLLLDPAAKIPARANATDAGFDLAALRAGCIPPNQRLLVDTGVVVEFPRGYFGLLRSRSSIASKHSVDVCAGVVDEGYRNTIRVLLHNLSSDRPFHFQAGDAIAQMILVPYLAASFDAVDSLSKTDRGTGGFGSTGAQGGLSLAPAAPTTIQTNDIGGLSTLGQ